MNIGEDRSRLEDICRTCLSNNGELKSFLNNSKEAKEILTKLTSVLNMEIGLDMFSCNICCLCESMLNTAYEFQQLGIKSHKILLDRLTNKVGNNQTVLTTENFVGDTFPDSENENSGKSDETDLKESSDNACDSSDGVNYSQTMRLSQHSEQEVEYVITKVQELYLKENKCIYCDFNAKGNRALSVHMSKLHKSERKYWCSLCNSEHRNLPLHIYSQHKEDLKCPFCSKVLNKTSHLIEHLYSHTRKRKFLCNSCNKSFISPRHLRMHQIVHSRNQNCHVCGKYFKSIRSLRLHMKTHFAFDCKLCQSNFTSLEECDSHKCSDVGKIIENPVVPSAKDDSKSPPQNYCKECDRKVRSLRTHKELHHSQKEVIKCAEKPSLCTYCGKQFRFASKLSIHLRSHTGETPYKCRYCDRRFATRGHLVVHERVHTGEKPHICSVCGKAFTQSSMLNTHMKIHTGKTIACLLCPKKFCRQSELKQHMRTHSGEKPFLCTQCGSSFKQRSHLVEHSRTHNKERPYQCEYCDKSFKKMGTLKIHFNVHSVQDADGPSEEVKSHKCAVCLESFATLALFTSHYASNHKPLTEAATLGIETTCVDVMGSVEVVPSAELHFSEN